VPLRDDGQRGIRMIEMSLSAGYRRLHLQRTWSAICVLIAGFAACGKEDGGAGNGAAGTSDSGASGTQTGSGGATATGGDKGSGGSQSGGPGKGGGSGKAATGGGGSAGEGDSGGTGTSGTDAGGSAAGTSAGGTQGGQGGAAGGPTTCSAGRPCPSAQTCCDGRCSNVLNDPTNCGACGVTCTGQDSFCGDRPAHCMPPPCDSGRSCSSGSCCFAECCADGQLCCEVYLGGSETVRFCHTPTAVEPTCPIGCPDCF
jgi:hypothetical protein